MRLADPEIAEEFVAERPGASTPSSVAASPRMHPSVVSKLARSGQSRLRSMCSTTRRWSRGLRDVDSSAKPDDADRENVTDAMQ